MLNKTLNINTSNLKDSLNVVSMGDLVWRIIKLDAPENKIDGSKKD